MLLSSTPEYMGASSNINDLEEEACLFLKINTIYLGLYCSTYNVSIQMGRGGREGAESLVKRLRNQYNQTQR